MNALKDLQKYGQSIWLDYIRRRPHYQRREIERLLEEGGLRGVTSNPTIFVKAIAGSTDYDDTLSTELKRDPQSDASQRRAEYGAGFADRQRAGRRPAGAGGPITAFVG